MVRVAIVEDEASNARAVARLLRASGMESVTFASAEDYLERADASEIDCVVLDIQLGGMSGFDLQSQLTMTHPDLPVIFLSAHEESETLARARIAGCPFVRKTEPGRILLEAIRGAVERRSRFP
jgi:FixJ family two-component response regulator